VAVVEVAVEVAGFRNPSPLVYSFHKYLEALLLDSRRCVAKTAEELDDAIRDIFELDKEDKGDQITGILYVHYAHESVKEASLVRLLESRGVTIEWRKTIC
jgi:hypothetical protein